MDACGCGMPGIHSRDDPRDQRRQVALVCTRVYGAASQRTVCACLFASAVLDQIRNKQHVWHMFILYRPISKTKRVVGSTLHKADWKTVQPTSIFRGGLHCAWRWYLYNCCSVVRRPPALVYSNTMMEQSCSMGRR